MQSVAAQKPNSHKYADQKQVKHQNSQQVRDGAAPTSCSMPDRRVGERTLTGEKRKFKQPSDQNRTGTGGETALKTDAILILAEANAR